MSKNNQLKVERAIFISSDNKINETLYRPYGGEIKDLLAGDPGSYARLIHIRLVNFVKNPPRGVETTSTKLCETCRNWIDETCTKLGFHCGPKYHCNIEWKFKGD